MSWLTFAFLILLCVVHAECLKDRRPPEYIINLDLPEEKRWDAVMSDFKYAGILMNKILSAFMPKYVIPLVSKIASRLDDYLPSPFAGEIRGTVRELVMTNLNENVICGPRNISVDIAHTSVWKYTQGQSEAVPCENGFISLGIAKALGVEVGELLITNIFYDLTPSCTSIVAQDSNGRIWHGRNLDYRFTDILRNITLVAHFQRNGKTVYSGVTYAGYVGILTGQRPNSFTVSIDARHRGDFWKNFLVAILERNASFMSFLMRETLDEAQSYAEAVVKLDSTITISTAYYIVGGIHPGQGAVITKGRLRPRDTWFLDPNHGRWYLVETNYDHWEAPPTTDNRRLPAMKYLNATGQANINDKALFKILSTPALLRSETTYTTVMSAAHPRVFNTWIRDQN